MSSVKIRQTFMCKVETVHKTEQGWAVGLTRQLPSGEWTEGVQFYFSPEEHKVGDEVDLVFEMPTDYSAPSKWEVKKKTG